MNHKQLGCNLKWCGVVDFLATVIKVISPEPLLLSFRESPRIFAIRNIILGI